MVVSRQMPWGWLKLGAEGQLLVPEEGMHSEEYAHKHTDVPRFGALARGNARTSCMSDHTEPDHESYSDAPRAVCLSCSKDVSMYH